jgi:hypothetical protein
MLFAIQTPQSPGGAPSQLFLVVQADLVLANGESRRPADPEAP